MFGPAASAVMVFEPQGDRLAVRGQAGLGPEGAKLESLPVAHCFAELVIAENKTAALADAALRPDLSLVHPPGEEPFRAVLAAPMRSEGRPFGVVGIYSHQTQEWTAEQFRLAEWLAAQCAHILETLRLQRQLRESEEKYRDLVQNANSIIIRWDMKGNFTFFNEFAERFFGFSQREIIGKNVIGTIVPPTDTFGRDLAAMIEDIKRYPDRYETNTNENVRKNGERVWISWSNRAILDERGNMIGVLAVGNDTTERKRAEEAVRESEERLRFALETSRTGAWEIDLADHIAHRSPGHDSIFGYDQMLPEWTYEMFLDHVVPEDRALVDGKFRHAVATQGDWNFECLIRRADGETRWIWAAGRHHPDAAGTTRRMSGIVQDITERKLAEQSKARLAAIVESSDNAILSKDLHGIIETWNPGAERLFGYRAEEVIGQPITLLLPPERIREEEQILERVRSGQPVEHLETVRVAKDGRQLDVSVTVSPVKDHDGRIIGVSKIIRDITERKQAEAALCASEERFQQITACVQDVLYSVDGATREFQYLSPAFERLLGYSPADVAARGGRERFLAEVIQDGRFEEQQEVFRQLKPAGGTVLPGRWAAWWQGKDGMLKYLEDHWMPVFAGDRVAATYGVLRDITERKRADEALRQTAEDLARSNKDLEQFAYVASHDLREPLRMVTGFMSLLKDRCQGKLDAKADEYIFFASDAASRMQGLIDDLLAYSRAGRGETTERTGRRRRSRQRAEDPDRQHRGVRGGDYARSLADDHVQPGGTDPGLPEPDRQRHHVQGGAEARNPRRRPAASGRLAVHGPRQRDRHRSAVCGPHFLDLPALAHPGAVPGHRDWPGNLQEGRGASRRPYLGRVPAGKGLDVLLYDS